MSFFGKKFEMFTKGYESVDEKDKKETALPQTQPNAAQRTNPPPSQSLAPPKTEVWGYGTFKK